jgi:outer membrane autotransporter protein
MRVVAILIAIGLSIASSASAQTTQGTAAPSDTSSLLDIFPMPDHLFDLNGLRVWQTVYAGRSGLAGNAAQDTQSVSASILGTTLGADKQIDDLTLIGASRQTFSARSGNGRSDDTVLTLYGKRTIFDQAYIAVALGYGWHDLSTSRPITAFGDFSLDASYHAHDLGGRLEAGYGFTLDGGSNLAPFFAFVGDDYHQPGYSETASGSPSIFAASYAPSTIGVTHTELGSRYYYYFALDNGWYLSLDSMLAWERELDDNPLILASFQTSPGSSLVLHGTRPAGNTALIGQGLRLQAGDGFTFGIRSDARLGTGTTIFSGTGDITYRW